MVSGWEIEKRDMTMKDGEKSMERINHSSKTLQEEMARDQKYWKKNLLWTLFLLAGVFLWGFLSGPGLSVVPGATELTLTTHNGQTAAVAYSSITEAELLEAPVFGTVLEGTEQKNGKSGIWEHPQWGSYTLCVYNSCPSALRILTEEGCYVVNLASRQETDQLYQLIQDKMPASR